MSRALRYRVVDVFTNAPLEGNPLAVFPEGSGISADEMQRIARELNLSETVFIVPPQRDACLARLRIFTPTMEMKFAGHPTVGASFVLWDEGVVPRDADGFVLDEQIGPVPIRVEHGTSPMFWLTTPPIEFVRTYSHAECAALTGLGESDLLAEATPQQVSAGNPNVYIALRDKAAVDRAWIDLAGIRALHGGADPACFFVFTPTPEGAYSRMFAPEHGVVEDPATGSATGPLAAYMMKHGLMPTADGTRIVSEQGTKMGRRSLLHIIVRGEGGSSGIEVGGHVVPLVEANMTLP
jgi:trans-2,3-dihydro-3-hydroxyanthranilate isomerase